LGNFKIGSRVLRLSSIRKWEKGWEKHVQEYWLARTTLVEKLLPGWRVMLRLIAKKGNGETGTGKTLRAFLIDLQAHS